MGGNRPEPPRPELSRRPNGPFGWLDARLLQQGWLASLEPEAVVVLVFLALVADRQGVSFYRRERMASMLALERQAVDRALERLLALELAAYRPWRPGAADGVWQLLPLPRTPPRVSHGPTAVSDLLGGLGIASVAAGGF